MTRGNGAARRWALVVTLVAVLAALPALVAGRRRTTTGPPRNCARPRWPRESLRFSGTPTPPANLALPVTDQLSSARRPVQQPDRDARLVARPVDNRVDVVTAGGETGTSTGTRRGTWTWQYETATAPPAPRTQPLELPPPPDVLPSTLGRRLLSEAEPGSCPASAPERVAGRDTLGLRLTPAAAASSVRPGRRLRSTAGPGCRCRSEVCGEGRGEGPALDTRFVDLDLAAPTRPRHRLRPAPGRRRPQGDEPRWCSRPDGGSVRCRCPPTLAGLPRRTPRGGAAGDRALRPRRHPARRRPAARPGGRRPPPTPLAPDPDAVVDDLRRPVAAGPLGLLLVVDAPGRAHPSSPARSPSTRSPRAAAALPGREGAP